MKPFFFLCVTCVVAGCGGLLKSQSKGETGADSATDSLSSRDVASNNASDWEATDVADDAATDALGGYETCPLSGGSVMRVPSNHRASTTCAARAATTSVDPSACGDAGEFSCASDADCSETSAGFCYVGNCYSECLSDACHADSECPSGQMCACIATGNACIAIAQGSCLTDSDCGACGFCSLNLVECGMSHKFCGDVGSCEGYAGIADGWVSTGCNSFCSGRCTQGYFCHTPQDNCTDDSDCGVASHCAFASVFQSWMCVGDCPVIP
jgi:hypothetical protein